MLLVEQYTPPKNSKVFRELIIIKAGAVFALPPQYHYSADILRAIQSVDFLEGSFEKNHSDVHDGVIF